MTIEVTEDVRRAVYEADCAAQGHLLDFNSAVGSDPDDLDPQGVPKTVLTGPEDGQLPHVRCRRCSRVWLLIDVSGANYDDAVRQVGERLRVPRSTRDEVLRPRRRKRPKPAEDHAH